MTSPDFNFQGSTGKPKEYQFNARLETSSGNGVSQRQFRVPSLRHKAITSVVPVNKQQRVLKASLLEPTTGSLSVDMSSLSATSPFFLTPISSPTPSLPSTTSTTSTTSSPSPEATPKKQFSFADIPFRQKMTEDDQTRGLAARLALLQPATGLQEAKKELVSTPIFTRSVLDYSAESFSQYGFLAGNSSVLDCLSAAGHDPATMTPAQDPSVFFNISAPSSAFICGSQGSGKSHTLSVLLESCLLKLKDVNKLDNPLAALVFHYDSFISDLRGTPCEAAHLSSNPNIKVRVLCSPSNIQTIKRTYMGMNVEIEPLKINQNDLNTKRMLDLMAVNQDDGRMPLYLHEITRILREMRVRQQQNNGSFNYAEFKQLIALSPMTPAQQAPLTQRLDSLESFMPKAQTQPGTLTIVDLSCPCVTSDGACALFNMCLSLFLEQKTNVGRIVALDEAHKYMNTASEATTLTNTLLSCIRLQRHLGTRVFISTQEPSISPKLLDLCSITIVHRFTSPDWLRCLRSHIAALDNDEGLTNNPKLQLANIFNQIVKLTVGQALLFAPSAVIDVELPESGESKRGLNRLGIQYLRIKIRDRVTTDGGRSVMALGS
ncbi:hypothetical protein MBM_01961 [Drepanopeziza brunnea f. sp. 'multigermtubi' MB_m1]|uniref:P-loop containing nucleoside triphosphate hydrolase n=1 Tax=Marssonina brunnea f. sp. multigermtubi (strain MB_m1) TaxID=1072389 RepID=K1Y495_MARBU|nr:uncharacterized protein MBM_01961 [Drepanopeziza brunnea f. sp. 'multigermtubi' MB_m1]EKD20009.1 hypothetical protein MBM_01961 [Drepanopeziza brunnea f. sp. 'multigermtubi' MB_m1]